MTLEKESVKTNIPLLDRQHEKYFDAVERLFEQCAKENPDHEEVTAILEETQDYAVDNFDTEEYLMQLEGYPDIDEHAEKHENFKERLDNFMAQLNKEPGDLKDMTKRLRALLVGWFNNQIKDDDMRMAAFLHTREKRSTRGE